jgi:hypothetical protein
MLVLQYDGRWSVAPLANLPEDSSHLVAETPAAKTRRIVKDICLRHRVSPNQVFGLAQCERSRSRQVVAARYEIIRTLVAIKGWNVFQTAHILGFTTATVLLALGRLNRHGSIQQAQRLSLEESAYLA